jgi:hypothetical protein
MLFSFPPFLLAFRTAQRLFPERFVETVQFVFRKIYYHQSFSYPRLGAFGFLKYPTQFIWERLSLQQRHCNSGYMDNMKTIQHSNPVPVDCPDVLN